MHSAEVLKQLLLPLPIPAQIWGRDGQLLFVNHAFHQLFSEDHSLSSPEDCFNPLMDAQFRASGIEAKFQRALEGSQAELQSVNYEVRESRNQTSVTGAQLRLFLTLYPIQNEEKFVECVVCVITDFAVSGGRFEHELMRSQRMENVEILASGVAHEFNNIFTGIRGLSDLIKDQVEVSSEAYEFAELIQQSITRGAELISKLNSFARELPHVLRRTSLADYVQQAIPLLQIQVTKRVAIQVVPQEDGFVMLDASRMDQALSNIFSNAKEAIGGSGRIQVSIRRASPSVSNGHLSDTGDWMLLEVADSGPGIPDAIQSRVIEPFFSTKERGRSTGLGLSMTHRIVSLHGGELEIAGSSDLGGAAIRIFLPMAPG